MYYLDIFLKMHRDDASNTLYDTTAMCKVDELMMPIISILNVKGYVTISSCSGHIVDDRIRDMGNDIIVKNNECYIKFINSNEDLLSSGFIVPEGFELESGCEDKYKSCIRKIYDDDKDRYIQILETMIQLYKWVHDLPIYGSSKFNAMNIAGATAIEPKNVIF